MDCNQVLDLISAALDGELTPAELAQLDAHLALCDDCRRLAEDFGVLSVALSDMEVDPPADLLRNVQQAIAPEKVIAMPQQKLSHKRRWASLAASLAVVLSLGFLYQSVLSPKDSSSAAPSELSLDAAGDNGASYESQPQSLAGGAQEKSAPAAEAEADASPSRVPESGLMTASGAPTDGSSLLEVPENAAIGDVCGAVEVNFSIADAVSADSTVTALEGGTAYYLPAAEYVALLAQWDADGIAYTLRDDIAAVDTAAYGLILVVNDV